MVQASLSLLVNKLRTRTALSPAAEAAILDLPFTRRIYDSPAYIVRDGSTDLGQCGLIVSGFAFRQKLTVEGARQIVSVHMRGDLLDLQHLFLKYADHNIQALTRLEILNIERAALQDLILRHPSVGTAMWIDLLVDASIYRTWITNVGRRDARTRVAHLLCEFAVRLKAAGLGDGGSCSLPMTQEQIGDAVGLTSVHVNRTLKALERDGVIQRSKRDISFTDWQLVRRVGDFSASYLHLDQTSTAGESVLQTGR